MMTRTIRSVLAGVAVLTLLFGCLIAATIVVKETTGQGDGVPPAAVRERAALTAAAREDSPPAIPEDLVTVEVTPSRRATSRSARAPIERRRENIMRSDGAVADPAATARRAEAVRSGETRRYLPSDRPEYWDGDSGVWKYLSYRVKQVHYVVSHVMPDAPGVRDGVSGRDTANLNPTGYR